MKKVIFVVACMALAFLCSEATGQAPPSQPTLGTTASPTEFNERLPPSAHGFFTEEGYWDWFLKNKLAPREYFALAFIESFEAKKPTTVVVTYSGCGLSWLEHHEKSLATNEFHCSIKGVDITNHRWGTLQSFVYDFDELGFGKFLAYSWINSFRWDSDSAILEALYIGPPSTVIHKKSIQIIASNTRNRLKLYQTKVGLLPELEEVRMPETCQSSAILRPDLALLGDKAVIVWRTYSDACSGCFDLAAGLGIVDPTGGLKMVHCCREVSLTGVEGCKLISSPAIGCDGTLFYMGMIIQRKEVDTHELVVFTSNEGCRWELLSSVTKLHAVDYKLGLAVNSKSRVLVAVLIKDKQGIVKNRAWLSNNENSGNWSWIYLDDAPWVKSKPAYKEFGLDSGGVAR